MSRGFIEMSPALHDYILDVSLREPAILTELRNETSRMPRAGMQISPEQGQLMALLVKLTGATRLLEVGTFTGYSSTVCGLAMPPEGRMICCDVNREWTDMAQRYWQKAGVSEKIQLHLGPATETLQALIEDGQIGTFDMMFIDADKSNYDAYYERGLQLIRPGGLILVDNVLWGGSVIEVSDQDEDTVAIRAFNKKLKTDDRVTLSMLSIGDGLTIALKR